MWNHFLISDISRRKNFSSKVTFSASFQGLIKDYFSLSFFLYYLFPFYRISFFLINYVMNKL